MVTFNQVPTNIRIPFVAVEFDSSRAQQGPALLPYRVLIIGQKTSGGTAVANSLHRVTNANQVLTLAGRGSMLHRMAIKYFANNSFTETYIGVLADNGAGVAATGKVTWGGTATAPGTVNLYLGGELVQVAVAVGDDGEDISAKVVAAIAAKLDLPVTAAIGGEGSEEDTVLTFRHKGLVGNSFNIRLNYQDGEALPAGVSASITAMASGTTAPDLATLISNLGDEWFHVWAMPYTDATTLTAAEAELSSRFGPMRMIDGVCFTASAETHANLGTLGDSRNSPHVSIAATNQSPAPVFEYAAAVAAVAAYFGNIDPARPFQTLPLIGILPPAETDRFTNTERNLLLYDGISVTKVAPGGVVVLDRLITTYKQNAAGADDTAYLDVTTMLTLLYLRFTFRNRIVTRYPRHKLGDDGKRYGFGQPIMTPKIGKAEASAWFRDMQGLGLVEVSEDAYKQFMADLVVERAAGDPNRMNWLLSPDLMNQFIVGAAQIQFRL